MIPNLTFILLMAEILHHLRSMKPYKQWEQLPINWCRISAINRIFQIGLKLNSTTVPRLELFQRLGLRCWRAIGTGGGVRCDAGWDFGMAQFGMKMKDHFIPAPSKGCQMVPFNGCQFTIP